MTTNTTINYAKLADDAADTYTSARDALNRAIANLALITEVHRLVHQDSNMGALLRELRDSEEGQELAVYPDFPKMFSFVANFECRANSAKDALLDSASDTLRKAIHPTTGTL